MITELLSKILVLESLMILDSVVVVSSHGLATAHYTYSACDGFWRLEDGVISFVEGKVARFLLGGLVIEVLPEILPLLGVLLL